MKVQRPIFVVGSFVVACSVKVPRLPLAGETLRASGFHLEAGGKGFNCAVALGRLGEHVDGVLMTGDDLFAGLAQAALDREGLAVSMLLPVAGQTGAGVGLIQPDGENVIAVFAGANDSMAPEHIRGAGARIAAASMVIGQFEIGDAPLLAAFEKARKSGAITVINPSPFRPIDPQILRLTDMIVMNAVEAEALARMLDLDRSEALSDWQARLAEQLIDKGLNMVVITASAKGARAWLRDGQLLDQPAFDVVAVDGIGAGDAFLAGLCSALNRGETAASALCFAAECGALVASRNGVLDALPFRHDVGFLQPKT